MKLHYIFRVEFCSHRNSFHGITFSLLWQQIYILHQIILLEMFGSFCGLLFFPKGFSNEQNFVCVKRLVDLLQLFFLKFLLLHSVVQKTEILLKIKIVNFKYSIFISLADFLDTEEFAYCDHC